MTLQNTISNNQKRSFQEAFKIALMVVTGSFIYRFYHLPNGNWIVAAICYIYISGSTQGFVMKRANERFMGTLVGLIMAFLFVNIFMHANYHWAYILPFVWFLAFYLYLLSGHYTIRVAMTCMFVIIFSSVMAPAYKDFSVWSALFSRMFATVIAGSIIVFFEFIVFRKATLVRDDIRELSAKIFEEMAFGVSSVTRCYVNGEEFRNEYWTILADIARIYGKGQKLHASMEFEIGHDITRDKGYEEYFKYLETVSRSLRGMICIANHNDGQKISEADKKKLIEASEIIAGAFEKLEPYASKELSVAQKTKDIFENADFMREERYPECFFAENLIEAAGYADKLLNIIGK